MRRHLLTLSLLLAGCIEPAPLANKGEPRRPTSPVVPGPAPATPPTPAEVAAAAPMPSLPEGAKLAGGVFGNSLQIMAYKLEPPTAAPGATVRLTTWMRVIGPLADDDKMFMHIDDSDGRPERVNGDHWPAGHKVPMNQWKKGEVVADTYDFTLTGFTESRAATLWVGFYQPERDERLPLTNPNQVRNDGNNRYALAELPIAH
jgi:hypothetical protein